MVTAVSTIPLEVKGGYGIETEAFRLVDGREVSVGKVAAKWMENGEVFVSGKVNVPLQRCSKNELSGSIGTAEGVD